MTQRAAIYCRISRDPEGLRAGVDRQREDCEKFAESRGWAVVGTFIDNDLSASTLSRKVRPEYQAMLSAARRGEFEMIVAYSNSRLTRRLLELEDLIQLHEQYGTIISTVVSGQDDLSTADGRMVARIKGSVDASEAERAGERIRRAHLQAARAGKTNHSGRPFGWAKDKIAVDPVEAKAILGAAEDVINGVPLRAIAREWNDRGVRTSRGGLWTHTTLRRLLQRPRLIGQRTHRGQVVLDATGTPVVGEWVPIMDEELFARVQAALERSVRGGARPGRRRYLLTGIVRCGTCGGRMVGVKTLKGHAYTCCPEPATHSVTVIGEPVERLLVELAKRRLEDEDLGRDVAPRPAVESSRLEQIPGLIAELMTAFREGRLSGAVVIPAVEDLEEERAKLQAARVDALAATAVPSLVDVSEFDELSVDRQRALLDALFEAVIVRPAKRRGEIFTPDRVSVVWR